MTRRASVLTPLALFLFSGACSSGNWLPPRPVREAYDAAYRRLNDIDPYWRCELPDTREDGVVVGNSLSNRDCYDWGPRRRFQGIYIDEFEGQRFLENTSPSPRYVPKDHVWLDTDGKTDFSRTPALSKRDGHTRIWQVDFIGRKTTTKGEYGHMGGSSADLLVDRMISARLIATYEGYLPEDILKR